MNKGKNMSNENQKGGYSYLCSPLDAIPEEPLELVVTITGVATVK